jgi:hypothetical protein
MRLAAEALTEPAFPPNEFEKQKREQLAALDEHRTDPENIAERAIERWNNPYPRDDVRYVPTFDEEMAEINGATLEQVKGVLHALCRWSECGARGGRRLRPRGDPHACDGALRGLEESEPLRARSASLSRTKAHRAVGDDPDKANASLFGKLPLQINDLSPDLPALMVADRILGASPESRIPDRVREREGLSYTIQTWLSLSSFEANSPLNLYAIYAPQNRDKVRVGISEEMARALKDGFTEAEVTHAKRALLQARRIARAQDGALAGGLVNQAYLGRSWDYAAKIDAGIEAVTVARRQCGAAQIPESRRIRLVVRGRFQGQVSCASGTCGRRVTAATASHRVHRRRHIRHARASACRSAGRSRRERLHHSRRRHRKHHGARAVARDRTCDGSSRKQRRRQLGDRHSGNDSPGSRAHAVLCAACSRRPGS